MLEAWKKRFTITKFIVVHDRPWIFIRCAWQKNSKPNLYYCLYKWLIAAFFLISLILSIINPADINQSAENRAKWLIYLTNWGFTLCTVQALLSAFMLTSCFLTTRNRDTGIVLTAKWDDNKALKLYKIYWITNNIATSAAFGITIIYWSFIYDESKGPLDGMNFIVHVGNSILMLLDLCIVAHPVRITHFYCSLVFGVCYIIFSIIYFLCGGTSKENTVFIYPILDWTKSGTTALVCFLVLLFLILLHSITYGIYKLRKHITKKLHVGMEDDYGSRNNHFNLRNYPGLSNIFVP